MNNFIGIDCGATHSKIAIWKTAVKTKEESDWPGMNMDLINETMIDPIFTKKIAELSEYDNFSWVVALAGVDSEEERQEAERWWRLYLVANGIKFRSLKVISDVDLVIWSGSPKGVGIGLISGTGSSCTGLDTQSNRFKVGGMSHLMSDEGSGFALGWQCLRLITKMADGRLPKTGLYPKILDLYEVKSVVDLKNKLFKSPNQKAEIAKSSRLLIDAASTGDQLAAEVVSKEILELVLMVSTVNRLTKDHGVLDLYVAGSLFKNQYYLQQFKQELAVEYPSQSVTLVTPIDGVPNLV